MFMMGDSSRGGVMLTLGPERAEGEAVCRIVRTQEGTPEGSRKG